MGPVRPRRTTIWTALCVCEPHAALRGGTPWQPRQRVVLSLPTFRGRPDGESSSGLLARFSPILESWVRNRRSRSRFKPSMRRCGRPADRRPGSWWYLGGRSDYLSRPRSTSRSRSRLNARAGQDRSQRRSIKAASTACFSPLGPL
jgi:hypothetical protein